MTESNPIGLRLDAQAAEIARLRKQVEHVADRCVVLPRFYSYAELARLTGLTAGRLRLEAKRARLHRSFRGRGRKAGLWAESAARLLKRIMERETADIPTSPSRESDTTPDAGDKPTKQLPTSLPHLRARLRRTPLADSLSGLVDSQTNG